MNDYQGLVLAAEFEFGGTRAAIEEDLVKLANDVSVMLRNHSAAKHDWLVSALAPKGQADTIENLRIWEITAGAMCRPLNRV